MNHGRNTRDGPFCWQNKQALRAIRDHFDATNNVTSALSVYVALSEIESDEQGQAFDRPIGEIGRRAGVGYKTASKILLRLESLGFIAITRHKVAGTKEHAPSTYQLLRFGNKCRRLGNGRDDAPLPRGIEQSLEQRIEEDHTSTLSSPHHSDEWRRDYQESELAVIDLYNEICVPNGWRRVNKYSEALQSALELVSDMDEPELREIFKEAAKARTQGDPGYNTRLGNKLIRILQSNR